MLNLNHNFENLKKNYLFVDIQKRTENYLKENPNAHIIKMGIGDVTLPISQCVSNAMKNACSEMENEKTFKGYGPYEGYDFLKNAICSHYFDDFGVKLNLNEIYVSDGAKSDASNILDIFSSDSTVMIADPVYPVYFDSGIIRGNKIKIINATKENNFLPLPKERADIIYLCSPNNPTGAVYDKEKLKIWVDFALENESLIIFDAAYESFISDESLPRSIFEIEGARNCAVELCSFSKSAGFTGVRCAYMVIPNELVVNGKKIGDIWLRRQSIKFNGVSYITQRGAQASLSKEGKAEVLKSINYYKRNAKLISDTLCSLGIWNCGGDNSPYIWMQTPNNMKSWDFFDILLKNADIVSTPGVGFGECGEGFMRLSSFNSYKNTLIASERLKNLKF